MRDGKGLGRHLPAPVDDARIERQWHGVVALRSKRRFHAAPAVVLALAAVLAVAVIATLFHQRAPVAETGTVVETATANVQPLRLADGSRLEVARRSRVEVVEVTQGAVRLLLTRGAVTAEVEKSAARVFSITAGGYDIIVRGTKFQVTLVEVPRPAVTVLVERGRVEVRPTGSVAPGRFLDAGEGWTESVRGEVLTAQPPAPRPEHATTRIVASAPEASGAPTAPAADVASAPADSAAARAARASPASASSRPEVPAPSAVVPRPVPEFAGLVKERRYREAFESLGEGGFSREIAGADARRLLELSDVARLSGHPADAARALDRLRSSFRGDSRAGLAALELGRLRMDALGDRRGALAAFDDAVALSRGGAVREDAEARRVQVLEALGDWARCRSARDAYLSNFPNGVHASAVRARCSPK